MTHSAKQHNKRELLIYYLKDQYTTNAVMFWKVLMESFK